MTAGNRVLCMKTVGELDSTEDFYLLSLGTIGKKRRLFGCLGLDAKMKKNNY